ncbi:MAG: hypothetical protein SWO11_10090 [Thermodesulfobacteriota bacterium]|nr:hypothetical protein [Thermodesulfobacteriota bacterium]
MARSTKSFHIKSLKIFSYYDTVYLNARKDREPGKSYKEPGYDPLLAIHMIEKVEPTDRVFNFFMTITLRRPLIRILLLIKVEVDFVGFAARYAAEKI